MSDECPSCAEHNRNPTALNMDFEDLMNKWGLSTVELLAAAGEFTVNYNDAVNDSFLCVDCSRHTGAIGDYYMVSDEVWAQAHPNDDGMLCGKCLSKRLGRPLYADDFPEDIPLNQALRDGTWRCSDYLRKAMKRARPTSA